MSRMLILSIISLSILFSDYLGGYPGSGYRYATNAREMSLGNAILCKENQGFNAFLNPALLSKINNLEFGISYFLMSLDRYVQVFSVSRKLSSSGGASLSLFQSGVKNIQGKDFNNQSTGSFDSNESYLMLSFGSEISSKISIGINVKAIFNNIKSNCLL